MREYLMTNEELYQKAVTKLGSMNEGNYETFLKKAQTEFGAIGSPLLVIDISFNEATAKNMGPGQPYPINAEEWDIFLEDSKTMCQYTPNVYLVDGSLYTAPI